MCIKWLKVNEILNKYYYLLVAALNRTQWAITPSMGTPATNTLNIRIFPLSLFSGWIKRENNINQPGHRHTHPPHGQDGAPQFVWLMETSSMEFTVFTKHWMALLWTAEMSIPHPLIKPLKRWILIQLTVILGRSWCSQEQQRAQKMRSRILHWYHDLSKTS